MNESRNLIRKRKAKYRAILHKYGPISVKTKIHLDEMFLEFFMNPGKKEEDEQSAFTDED